MKNKDKIQLAIAGLLDMFRSGEIPEKIAIATNPHFNVPSNKWSLNNRLIQLFHGTFDSRGIRQWGSAGRKIKKGSKAIYILAPRDFEYYQCQCGISLFGKSLEENKCKQCSAEIARDEIKQGVTFTGVPVFRVEDTEGKGLPYENIPVPKHSFMKVAKAWGIEVKSSAFIGNAYGSYQRGKKIVLASPEELVFFHELAHAAHYKLGLLREKHQDSSNEIVAEFSASVLATIHGKKANIGNCYEYLEHYAKKKNVSVERAVTQLISEIEKVINLILKTDTENQKEVDGDMSCCPTIHAEA